MRHCMLTLRGSSTHRSAVSAVSIAFLILDKHIQSCTIDFLLEQSHCQSGSQDLRQQRHRGTGKGITRFTTTQQLRLPSTTWRNLASLDRGLFDNLSHRILLTQEPVDRPLHRVKHQAESGRVPTPKPKSTELKMTTHLPYGAP